MIKTVRVSETIKMIRTDSDDARDSSIKMEKTGKMVVTVNVIKAC